MDRKTLIAFSLIAVVLIFTPWYMNLVSPMPDPIEPVNGAQIKRVQSETVKLNQPLNMLENQSLINNSAIDFTIETNLYKVIISSKNGGSINSFKLFNFKKFDEGMVDIISTDNNGNMLINFISVDGQLVSLNKNWSSSPSNRSTAIRNGEVSILFETNYLGRKIKKKYTFYADRYDIDVELIFNEPSKFISRNKYSLVWQGGLLSTEKNVKDDYTYFEGYAYLGDELLKVGAKKGKILNEKQSGQTHWTAIKSKYFISAIIPEEPGLGAEIIGQLDGSRPNFTTSLEQSIGSSNKFKLYMGPLDLKTIQNFNIDLDKTINLGWSVFRPIGGLITWSLTKLHSIIPNYGVVVILFALIVKILLNPLTAKTFKSTKAMQALAPEIQKLKDRYKNDPKKVQMAQMKLYKEKGVNPMGGCLPMLIQMPILVSVFSIFRSKIEFRGAPFFGWISDLSVPDTLFTVSGFPINILPFVMGATMFFQQKMMAAPNQDSQQKMMMYFMNIFFLFLFYTFPSGLNLYYTVFNALTIVQQKYFVPETTISDTGTLIKNIKK